MAHFSFILLALDFNLLNISFFAMNYWKRGTFDFIAKPFELNVLELVINRALERYFIYKKLHAFRRLFFFLVTGLPLFLLIGIMLGLALGK